MTNSKRLLAFGDCAEGQIPITRGDVACVNLPQEVLSVPIIHSGVNIKAISSGEKHTIFLTNDGALYSVGGNDYGQLGRGCDKAGSFTVYPITVSGGIKFIQISSGQSHNLAVADDGRIFAWGSNEFLQCGFDLHVPRVDKPTRIPGLIEITQCCAGPLASVVLLENNRVYVFGQICDTSLHPTEIQLLAYYPIVQVAAGWNYFAALTSSGQVLCWGKDYFGLSTDDCNTDLLNPIVVELTRDLKVIYICCGFSHTILLTENGRVFGFGSDAFGQLGGGKKEQKNLFRSITELLGTQILSVSCGRFHTVALGQNGRIYTFGQNSSGQLGLGTYKHGLTPSMVNSKLDEFEVTQVFSGWDQTFVLAYALPRRKRVESPLHLLKRPKRLSFDRIRKLVGAREKMELIADLECVFSTIGGVNGSFMYEDERRLECSERNHGINMDEVMYGFNSLENMGPTDAQTFAEIIQERLQSSNLNQLTTYIVKGQINPEMFKFVLILPWIHPMIHPNNNFIFAVFLPFINFLNRLPKSSLAILVHWWSQLAIRHFNRIVQSFMSGLELLYKKNSEQHHYFRPILDMLQILNKINRTANKISYDHFYLNCLSENMEMVQKDYAYWFLKQHPEVLAAPIPYSDFYWSEYPFVMNATAKAAILEVDSQLKMQIKMQQNRVFTVFSFQFIEVPYLIFRVRRAHIVEDTYQNITHYDDEELSKPLRVIFDGEEAEDAGGVRKEFFLLLFQQLLREDYGMFIEDETSHLIWFSGIEGDLANYEIVGKIMSLAIYNSVLVNFPFPLALYKYLLNFDFTLEDLKELHPVEGKSLEDILDYEDADFEDAFMLNFTINLTSFGHSEEVELKTNGRNIPVTKSNRNEFVSSYIQMRLKQGLHSQIAMQLEAFKMGFTKVLKSTILEFFQPRELMEMVIGNENYDWEEFKENCQYKGVYSPNHKTIQAFWEAFFELDPEQRKRFLKFVTGSDRIPIGGIKAVQLTIQPIPEHLLPVAHTCFNLLDLPNIADKSELYRRIVICLDHAHGFSLV
uniref:HECT domain-containing protein n=1 Tax=Acrobeloides nanus TaxID=290746 RepID=A0A914DW21_9BILA